MLEPAALPAGLPARAGVFVTIREGSALRGCVGTIEPTAASLAEEVVRSAVLAATDDPRFDPVQRRELSSLSYEVSVLGDPERVDGIGNLDPRVYGVIVVSGHRRGLLLPDIPGARHVGAAGGLSRVGRRASARASPSSCTVSRRCTSSDRVVAGAPQGSRRRFP